MLVDGVVIKLIPVSKIKGIQKYSLSKCLLKETRLPSLHTVRDNFLRKGIALIISTATT